MYLCSVKKFEIPAFYRSPVISRIKQFQAAADPRRESLQPFVLDMGPLRFHIPRHYGFCYGVENAIEIAFRAIHENPGKRIYLISQMIHNPAVNADLLQRGVRFLMDTQGNELVALKDLHKDDVVIIPAFGTTPEMLARLESLGVALKKYDTTCPFVERVWNKAEKLGREGFTVIVHGKAAHEETRATFSRSCLHSPSIIVLDAVEADILASFIRGRISASVILKKFSGKMSEGFNPERDLQRLGVINQTTMLASETDQIAGIFRNALSDIYGVANIREHFADTRDTLCYATNQNQDAALALAAKGGSFAVVVGGYNSSNTTHLVEILEKHLPVYFIESAAAIGEKGVCSHYDIHEKKIKESVITLPLQNAADILITSGASCPDAMVDAVITKISTWFPGAETPEEVLKKKGVV